jgi:hypothetical protein
MISQSLVNFPHFWTSRISSSLNLKMMFLGEILNLLRILLGSDLLW